jgi:hypothetical protein
VEGRFSGEKYISVTGRIEDGDLRKIVAVSPQALLESSGPLTLVLNSKGGRVSEAIKIGKWARELMVTVYVHGSTLYNPDTPRGKQIEDAAKKSQEQRFGNVPIRRDLKPSEYDLVSCYSACVLIFYGGVQRYTADNWDTRGKRPDGDVIPVIGLHRPYFEQSQFASLNPTEAKLAYKNLEKDVRGYLAEMGAPVSVSERMFSKASNQIDLVSDEEFRKLYQSRESFYDEWLIAKCGAMGPQAALTASEFFEYADLMKKPSAASATPQRLDELRLKIGRNNHRSLKCRSEATSQHQLRLLRQFESSAG